MKAFLRVSLDAVGIISHHNNGPRILLAIKALITRDDNESALDSLWSGHKLIWPQKRLFGRNKKLRAKLLSLRAQKLRPRREDCIYVTQLRSSTIATVQRHLRGLLLSSRKNTLLLANHENIRLAEKTTLLINKTSRIEKTEKFRNSTIMQM